MLLGDTGWDIYVYDAFKIHSIHIMGYEIITGPLPEDPSKF